MLNSCQCSLREINTSLFTNHVDQIIIHDTPRDVSLKVRRPDRVYGLQYIEASRGGPVKYLIDLKYPTPPLRWVPRRTWEVARVSLHHRRSQIRERWRLPVLLETDSIPYLAPLLNLQERLEKVSVLGFEEQSGPLAWWFANRGKYWKLYRCYMDRKFLKRLCTCVKTVLDEIIRN